MIVQEIKKILTDNYTHLTLKAGKKEAYIGYNHNINQLQVICLNASHQAFMGHGKYFSKFEDALKSYKSLEMKSLINAAQQIINKAA
jgi:hypothetical protein